MWPTLRDNANPFAVVVLTALLAIVHRNVNDDDLKAIKHDLYEEMMRRKMDKKTRQGLYDFLAYYVSFQNQDNFHIGFFIFPLLLYTTPTTTHGFPCSGRA